MLLLALLILIGVVYWYTSDLRSGIQLPFRFGSEPEPDTVENFDPFDDYDNINKELSRPVQPGRADIDNLIQMPTTGLYNRIDNQAYLTKPEDIPSRFVQRLHKWSKKECLAPNHPIYDVVRDRSPYIFPDNSMFEYYGKLYYHDWKYPLRPIDVKFAANPKKYCRRNPQTYPCYDWWKRHDLK